MKFSSCTLALALLACALLPTDLSAQISGQVVNFSLNRYNSATNGDKLTVEDGETIATMSMRAWTPANEYQTSTSIRTLVTGVPAAGFLPARMDFHNAPSNLWDMRRLTILQDGNVGIGFPQDIDPVTLFDVNGDARIRGLRLFLDDPNALGGGEALTRLGVDCLGAPLPTGNGLGLNWGGGFADGVFVDGPGLHVCGTMESNCLIADENIASRMGNIYTLGDLAGTVPDPCTLPAEGDFIAYGNNSDFIARHGDFTADEGDFTATQGGMTARLNIISQSGNIAAQGGNVTAFANVTATNGNVVSQSGNVSGFGHVIAETGNVTAQQGNVVSLMGNVSANQDVTAGRDVTAARDITSTRDIIAGDDLYVTDNLGIGLFSDVPAGWPDGYRLAVDGNIICEEVRVELQAAWPDYVFHSNYELMSLADLEKSIQQHGHLPNVPAAHTVETEGMELGEMQRVIMEKIEELTLYTIQQQKEIEKLRTENGELRKLIQHVAAEK